MSREYRCLKQQTYHTGEYSIVPLRDEDKYSIMKWRNEQLYHLRQQQLLTKENQERYFQTAVAGLFEKLQPEQLLFSYLENGICIGYGGLVHINWKDRHAEISFIINTELEKRFFKLHWVTYLSLIEQVAFSGIDMHKIFTYAFDVRPHLYEALEAGGFMQEARLKEHCLFDGKHIDVVIHSKINEK